MNSWTPCAYCGREIRYAAVEFKGKFYHALQGPNGEMRHRPETCWDLSELGTKTLVPDTAPYGDRNYGP